MCDTASGRRSTGMGGGHMARTFVATEQNKTIKEAEEWLNARPGTTITLPKPTSAAVGSDQAKVVRVLSFQLVNPRSSTQGVPPRPMAYDVIALLEVEVAP